MTEESFADLVRLADRWWKEGDVREGAVMPHHQRLQAEIAALPWTVRRVLVCTLIMENLAELLHGPRTGDGAAPCSVAHQLGLACPTCGWVGIQP